MSDSQHSCAVRVRNIFKFSVPHPGSQTAAAARLQPRAAVAAVTNSESTRTLPPAFPPCVSALAEASIGASAFSSELPSAGDRQAVAAIGSALVATADRDSMNATTLRVVAASSIAAKSKSVSARA